MSQDNFPACLAIILQSEGGLSDNPADPGHLTNRGVTQATLSTWLGRPATAQEVEALTAETVAPIYEQDFWALAHCPELPNGVDLQVFDCAVNSGPARAVKLLQSTVGVTADAHFGPMTKTAVGAMATVDLINRFHDLHEAFYRSLSTFATFGRGWLARNDRTRDLALQMVVSSAKLPPVTERPFIGPGAVRPTTQTPTGAYQGTATMTAQPITQPIVVSSPAPMVPQAVKNTVVPVSITTGVVTVGASSVVAAAHGSTFARFWTHTFSRRSPRSSSRSSSATRLGR